LHVASFLHQIFSIKQWKKKADFTKEVLYHNTKQ